MIWAMLARNLLVTVAVEVLLARAAFRVSPRDCVPVALAQLATNPAVNLAMLYAYALAPEPWPALILLALELGAFAVEGALYAHARIVEHPWLMSAVLNLASFSIGFLIRGL